MSGMLLAKVLRSPQRFATVHLPSFSRVGFREAQSDAPLLNLASAVFCEGLVEAGDPQPEAD